MHNKHLITILFFLIGLCCCFTGQSRDTVIAFHPHFCSLKVKLWNILHYKGLRRDDAELLSAASCSIHHTLTSTQASTFTPVLYVPSQCCQHLTLFQNHISPLNFGSGAGTCGSLMSPGECLLGTMSSNTFNLNSFSQNQ